MIFRYFLIIGLLTIGLNSFSQCTNLITDDCLKQFGEFVYDGNSSVSEMKEGDTAELFKTFFVGQTYRVVVCKSDNLPSVRIRVISSNGSVLFDNKDKNFEHVWDFAVKGTQKLIISIEVMKKDGDEKRELESGCVAILFGIDKDK
ncbi:MAG: hypothetical protein JW717_07135 [Marinilabiliaceae bacterium]|nr:hypothetical protein [Marinilabiliaceae bacterium]